jgi:hypothetical protein
MTSSSTSTTKSGQPAAAPAKRDRNPTTVVNLFASRPARVVENAAAALEAMPHLVERICLLWGTAECEPYINRLILDSRDGARQGLPWEAAQDLLFLAELSMAKRALQAAEITGVPFSQMFARCKETAERTGPSAGSGLSLAPKSDPWGDPRASSDTAREKRTQPAQSSGSRAKEKSGWLEKLLG